MSSPREAVKDSRKLLILLEEGVAVAVTIGVGVATAALPDLL